MVERHIDIVKVGGSIPPSRTEKKGGSRRQRLGFQSLLAPSEALAKEGIAHRKSILPVHIQIIYEDKNMLALNKPAGVLVHKIKKEDQEKTLTDWLVAHYPAVKKVGDNPELRPGIVHRLDRDTSGVILVPKNQEYFGYLKHLFQEHKVKKTYLALVYGKVEKGGVIDKPISIKAGTTKRTVHGGKMTKEAITEYRVREAREVEGNWYSLLEVMPKTGRTHQIRIHLSSIGHPIVGDRLYTPSSYRKMNIFGLERQFLHAYALEFSQTEGKILKIEAELPSELKNILKKLEIH